MIFPFLTDTLGDFSYGRHGAMQLMWYVLKDNQAEPGNAAHRHQNT